MKNKQPIFQSFLLIFFVFGMVQTAFSQSIDDKSKAILDKVGKHYASFETLRYQVNMISEIDGETSIDSLQARVSQTMLKIENEEGVAVSNKKTIISMEKFDNEIDTLEYDEFINLFWLTNIVDFMKQHGEISFVKTIQENGKTIHVLYLLLTFEEDGDEPFLLYIDGDKNTILKFQYDDEGFKESFIYTKLEANPTFPEDYFEIKN